MDSITVAIKVTTTDEKNSRWKRNDEGNERFIFCLHEYKIKKEYESEDREQIL